VSENVEPLTKAHAPQAADLHRHSIPTGFLSSLGPSFLRQLYKAISACPDGFGYVWTEVDGRVLGFVACSTATGKLYKQALIRRGLLMALPILRFIVRPSFIRRMWDTFRYPSETAEDLPPAEILSIAVSPDARGKGVGKALMQAAFDEFKRRRTSAVRVAVWAENETANAFYQRCGYTLAHTRRHHGLAMNIYVRELPAAG
jgi:ribosomal protein S18 acetylase RimI-like enzyme